MKPYAMPDFFVPLDRPLSGDEARALIHQIGSYPDLDNLPIAQPFRDAGFHVVRVQRVPEHALWIVRLRHSDGANYRDQAEVRRRIRAVVRQTGWSVGEAAGVYRWQGRYVTCVFHDPAGQPPLDPAWLEPDEP